jgi:hypothetical protein
MKAFIDPPKHIPFYLRIGIWISRKVTGRDLLPGKLLAWYPKVAISAGIMEAMVPTKMPIWTNVYSQACPSENIFFRRLPFLHRYELL